MSAIVVVDRSARQPKQKQRSKPANLATVRLDCCIESLLPRDSNEGIQPNELIGISLDTTVPPQERRRILKRVAYRELRVGTSAVSLAY